MNFQTLNMQRKLIMICSVIGLISIFLPWVTISAGMFGVSMSEHYNGFRGAGVWVFICFIATLAVSLPGDHTQKLNKSLWLVCLALALIAALIVVVSITKKQGDGGFGIVEARTGVGAWIALIASAGVLIFNWVYRQPGDNIGNSFESLKKDIPFKMASTENTAGSVPASSEKNKMEELEKLIDLKNKGHITEDEYHRLKSKLI
jgi:hypothetical protein